jgi:hypothetical protein
VTDLDSLRAATAAERWGLTPRVAQRDRPRVPGDGRDHRAAEPAPQGLHLTRGERRAHRPDRNQVLVALMVAPQAGLPLLRPPRRGNGREAPAGGQGLRAASAQWHTPSGATAGVADRALDRAATLPTRAPTARQGLPRGPATARAAQAALAQGDVPALAARQAGDRDHEVPAPDGGLAHRWVRLDSERRRPPAQRPVARQRRQQRDPAVNAGKTFGRTAFAGDAAARQARAPFAPALQATAVGVSAVRATPRSRHRGRPRHGAPPGQVGAQRAGAFASARATRHARLAPPSGFSLATPDLDPTPLPPPGVLAGDHGQVPAERGCRGLKAPPCFAAALELNKPARSLALCMVLTVCVRV